MRNILIRYQVKPGREAENRELIEGVFSELATAQPDKLRYTVLELDDGTFLHSAVVPDDPAANPLRSLAAFQRFQAANDRRLGEAVQASVNIVGNYKMLMD